MDSGAATPMTHHAALSWRAWGLIALAVAAGAALPPLLASTLVLTLLTQAAISGILATSVGALLRMSGVVSFGHATFYGIAAYLIALSIKHQWMAAEAAVVLALVVPTVLAFVLGLGIVRVPGMAFSMLTLAIGQAFHEFAVKARAVSGGDDGLAIALPPELFGLPIALFQRPHSAFVMCWLALAAVVFALYQVAHSRFGRITEAIRENEERARFIGYETDVPRALVLAISGLVAAIAGVLFALYNAFVSPEVLHWSLSGSALIMAIIGGPRLLWGPAFGAMVFFLVKDLAGNLTEHWQALIGLTLIVVTVLLPVGLGGSLIRLLAALRGGAAR
jgi:branched-chain amino acid transport system permease protein